MGTASGAQDASRLTIALSKIVNLNELDVITFVIQVYGETMGTKSINVNNITFFSGHLVA